MQVSTCNSSISLSTVMFDSTSDGPETEDSYKLSLKNPRECRIHEMA